MESVTSIYEKIDLEELSFDEESKESIKEYKNKVSWAKNVLFNNKMPLCNIDDMCKVLRYILHDIDHISIQEFDSMYSTKMLVNLKIKALVFNIIAEAPDEIKGECGFESKRIVFRTVFPDYYKTYFKPLTATEIFFCNGELKSGLIRAAKSKLDSVMDGQDIDEISKSGMLKKQRVSKAKNVNGNTVDKILYDAMTQFLDANLETTDFIEKMRYLASIKGIMKKKNEPLPGIFEVINERGCYANPLDFYMFNSPVELQTYYIDDYMDIRKEFFGDEDAVSHMISSIYNAYIEAIENDDF